MKNVILIFVLALALAFSGCGGAADSPDETEIPETDQLVIADGENCDFYIIRSDVAGESEVADAVRLRKALSQKCGVEVGIATDWKKNPVHEHEIVIGNTLRTADPPIDRIELGESGYIIKEENGKIFICGGSDEGTSLAVDYFIENFVKNAESKIQILQGFVHTVHHQYDIPTLYIDMNPVDATRTIAIPANADKKTTEAAENLRQMLYEKTGLLLEITNNDDDNDSAFVISDGKASVDAAHEIVVSDGKIVFSSSAKSGVSGCVDVFIDNYLADTFGSINFPSDFHYLDLGDYISVNYPVAE